MPVQSIPTITLDELRHAILTDASLPSARRSELASAIKRFCEICGRSPGEILADPAVIRTRASKASWQLAGLSTKAWSNLKSRLTAAMQAQGIAVHRRTRRNFVLSDSWDALLAGLAERDRRDLRRFAGWCSSLQITPDEVDQAVFQRFLRYFLEECTLTHPKERWHVHRRAWNRAIATTENTAFPSIEDVEPGPWRGRPWDDFPASLRQDLNDYIKSVTIGRKYTLGGRPLKQITVENYTSSLRQHLSRLVDAGVPIESFDTLAACLDTTLVHQGLELISGPDEDSIREEARARLSRLCVALISFADHCNVSEDHRTEFKNLLRTVALRSEGMTARNRSRLDQFRKPDALDRFMNLPEEVADRVEATGRITFKTASIMQTAALLALLQALPLRIKNAASLDLEKHIMRPAGGKSGPWLIRIPRSEVKNDRSIEGELSVQSIAIVDRYVRKYRPLLAKSGNTALFPGSQGGSKCPSTLSKQLARFVRRELGLEFHAHLIRHWAAFAYLEHHPGDYETVRQLLGHKSISVTIQHYASSSTESAYKLYDAMLTQLRHPADDAETEYL